MTQAETSASIARIRKRLQSELVNDSAIRRALTRVGLTTKTLARKNSPIDTGALRNSIQFKVDKEPGVYTLTVGSFGVPYARFQEFGFQGEVEVGSHSRTITKAFGRNLPEPVEVIVRQHTRSVNFEGNPYLRPAFDKTRKRVVDMFRKELFRDS